jgi:hypothetical protein
MSCGDRYGGRSPIDIRKTGRSNEKKGMGGGIGYAVMVEIEAAFCSVSPSDLATEASAWLPVSTTRTCLIMNTGFPLVWIFSTPTPGLCLSHGRYGGSHLLSE